MSTKRHALDYIKENIADFFELSRSIWEFAELSLTEYKSAAAYIEKLKAYGFTVEEKLCGIDTAFSGSFGTGRPYIGILAEFDALSGLSQEGGATHKLEIEKNGCGHGCGHNLLGAASLAAAVGVKQHLQSSGQSGTVILFGCPGEEGGASKALMARDGLWKKLDAVLTWHPGDANEVVSGTCNSCLQVLYKFRGLAAHAAGNPERGRSALDAVELMNIGVQFLREHIKPDARIHYSIINAGGPSPNVVQPAADVLYMIRSRSVKDVLELEKRVDKIAQGAALMTETSLEKVFVDACSNTVLNKTLQKLLYDNMLEVPLPAYCPEELEYAEKLKDGYISPEGVPGLGPKNDPDIKRLVLEKSENGKKALLNFVHPLYTGECFEPGSTDVGDVSWLTPTAQFNAVAWPAFCPGHSWQVVSSSASSIGDKAIEYAACVLCAAAIDLYEKPELLQSALKEFADNTADKYCCPVPPGAKLLPVSDLI